MNEFDKICDAVAASLGVKTGCLSYLILKQKYETNIYLTTDWHLWVKDRTAKIKPTPVYCRQNMDEILEQYEAREFPKNSLLIHLGDLVDDEFYEFFNESQKNSIFDEMFSDLPTKRILIRGNNDPEKEYRLITKHGWNMVDFMILDNCILTHMPIDMTNLSDRWINLHGHSHGHMYYWRVPYKRHIDLWDDNRYPVRYDIGRILNMEDAYRNHIKDISDLKLKSKEEFVKYLGHSAKEGRE